MYINVTKFIMATEEYLVWERDIDGESLVKNLLSNHNSGYSLNIIDDDTNYDNIDKSKKYHVKVTEYCDYNGIVWNYFKLKYYIKEIK